MDEFTSLSMGQKRNTYNFDLIVQRLEEKRRVPLMFYSPTGHRFTFTVSVFRNRMLAKPGIIVHGPPMFHMEEVALTKNILENLQALITKVQCQLDNPPRCKFCFRRSGSDICFKCDMFVINKIGSTLDCTVCLATDLPIFMECKCGSFRMCVRCHRRPYVAQCVPCNEPRLKNPKLVKPSKGK